jgi:hypothetical protein
MRIVARRLSPACPPYAKPSSNSSFDHDRSDAYRRQIGEKQQRE